MANCKTRGVFQPSHCRGLLYDANHGWMTGRMDGKLHEKGPRRPLLYVIVCKSVQELGKLKGRQKSFHPCEKSTHRQTFPAIVSLEHYCCLALTWNKGLGFSRVWLWHDIMQATYCLLVWLVPPRTHVVSMFLFLFWRVGGAQFSCIAKVAIHP